MKSIRIAFLGLLILLQACNTQQANKSDMIYHKENLLAWCIVPFDANERSPAERAAMLKELGIPAMAYDYRDRHIPFFSEEILALEKEGIRLDAVWLWVDPRYEELPGKANRAIMDILEESGVKTELWMGIPEQAFGDGDDEAKLAEAVKIAGRMLEEAEKIGCTLALYNHGGWFGEPENQVRIIEALGSEKLRIVYNFHHGHLQMDRFEELMDLMLPYLSVINLNGMRKGGPKIMTLGEGDRELEMLRIIRDSGYRGPIGIIGHTEGEDIRPVLERNLKGLEKLRSPL
jgi:sugar phosphate isomerase/epimerase